VADTTRIYIASDFHAAEKAWRKFLNAIKLNVYKADIALVAGDFTGKAIVPIVETDGAYEAELFGVHRRAGSPEELATLERDIADVGYYSAVMSAAEADRLSSDPGARDELLHGLMNALNREIKFDTSPTVSTTTAAEAFALRRGVCQDLTHIFIAAARQLGIPARYVGGHFYRVDGVTAQDAGHAWVEAYVENLGWVGFDPTNGIGTTEAHVRVAIGLDYLGAAPVRGTRFGGSGETLKVAVHVDQARQQTQS